MLAAGRALDTPTRARARRAKARRIRYARAAGTRRRTSFATQALEGTGVTILLIYKRLWPDPG